MSDHEPRSFEIATGEIRKALANEDVDRALEIAREMGLSPEQQENLATKEIVTALENQDFQLAMQIMGGFDVGKETMESNEQLQQAAEQLVLAYLQGGQGAQAASMLQSFGCRPEFLSNPVVREQAESAAQALESQARDLESKGGNPKGKLVMAANIRKTFSLT